MSTCFDDRRLRAAKALNLSNEIVLIAAGESIGIPGGLDQTYPFRAHPEYFWLTGLECPGGVLALDTATAEWTHFAPTVSELEKVWDGREQAPGLPLTELAAYLAARRGRSIVNLGAELPGVKPDHTRVTAVRETFTHARRAKDGQEIHLLERAAEASAAGYRRARPLIKAGATERAIQIELEAGFAHAGGDRTAYDTIVGGGPNSVIFHFTPSQRAFQAGELVLIDAGAEVARYCADVTRTYPASGRFTSLQTQIYEIVLNAQMRAVSACRSGREWRNIHLDCCRDIAEGLLSAGVLKGDASDLVDRGVVALFFPHGVGHLVGLGVRDAGGRLPGRGPRPLPGGINLRVDLPLEPGYVVTVEPGLYFIPAILNDPARREKFRDAVNWSMIDGPLAGFGGIRIEDNVLITTSEPRNLTAAIPKDVASIQS
jgi:Xaa-Pro aminopeptidase